MSQITSISSRSLCMTCVASYIQRFISKMNRKKAPTQGPANQGKTTWAKICTVSEGILYTEGEMSNDVCIRKKFNNWETLR